MTMMGLLCRRPVCPQQWKPRTSNTTIYASTCLFWVTLCRSVSSLSEPFWQRPCIQRVLQQQPPLSSPLSVLSFYYGVDYNNADEVQSQLEEGQALASSEMISLWFGSQNTPYDDTCRQHFGQLIQQAGTGQLNDKDEWSTTVNGVAAQLILCDQLSRNAFRGTSQAFGYDTAAISYAQQLSRKLLNDDDDDNDVNHLQGTLYPPYISNVILALMHSEELDHHQSILQPVLQEAQARSKSSPFLQSWWEQQAGMEQDHVQVLERFGRYPHRNRSQGRANTPEEVAWLANTDELPGWAKSQG